MICPRGGHGDPHRNRSWFDSSRGHSRSEPFALVLGVRPALSGGSYSTGARLWMRTLLGSRWVRLPGLETKGENDDTTIDGRES